MTDIDPRMDNRAVSVYENDAADEFPVLKAFQQYIDAEQAKSRKRMMLLCVFFILVLTIFFSVFVFLLLGANTRNQALNDRLVEYAMKDRDRNAAVVVQPPQENSAILSLASKLEDMRKALDEERERAVKAEQAAAKTDENARKRQPTAEEQEIARLKALLVAEKEKASAEREKQRQLELEAYRRKHYPELYEKPMRPSQRKRTREAVRREIQDADDEIDSILNDVQAIDYFGDEDDELEEPVRPRSLKKKQANSQSTEKKEEADLSEESYKIPVDVKNSSGSGWTIPLD